jgi:LmbE family N-acetylglucosaminyl deacetylase
MPKKLILFLAALLVAFGARAGVPEGSLLDNVRPGPDGRIDVLTVFAHQDDESIYGGGAVLKLMRDPRVHLHILCMTFDQTSDAIKNLKLTPDQSGNIRVKELESAAAVYGADEVIQFKYPSRSLEKVDPEKLISEIMAEIERTHAQIVFTHDPAGITGHWDHVRCSQVATEAFKRSNAQVLYYPTLTKGMYRVALMFKTYRTKGAPAVPDFKVDIRAEKKLKRLACYEHASQMHFTVVGSTTNLFLLMNEEYFARVVHEK